MTDLVLLGGGGHARSLLAALRLGGERVRGYIAPSSTPTMSELAYLGGDEQLETLSPDDVQVVNAVGMTGVSTTRRAVHVNAVRHGFTVARVVHPHAFIDPAARLGEGVQVLAGAIVNAAADIRDGALVNTGAIVEHDAVVEAHVHVAPGAILSGGVRVGEGAHVGLGARVIQGITIGSRSVVGAGAVVVRDVRPGATVVGVPAREMTDR